jgi:cytochrome c peroxidase
MGYFAAMRYSLAAIVKQQQPSRSIGLPFAHIAIAAPALLFAASACIDLPEEDTVVSSATVANDQPYANSLGTAATYTTAGVIDLGGPFFKSLGSNGRSCSSCHQLDEGLSITPSAIRSRFIATCGTDPLFATVDGSNSPRADVSTLAARRTAFSMLLNKGLIRVGLPIPANAEFTLSAVDDPYHFASASELSLFRRPLPTTNIGFLTTVMWDGRGMIPGSTIDADLLAQANIANLTHAQATAPLTAAQASAIVSFEKSLYTAQYRDNAAQELASRGSNGDAAAPSDFLATQPFYLGINDPLGDPRTGAAFDPIVFRIYDAWATTPTGTSSKNQARQSILRGQTVFNTKPIPITGVAGLNDNPAFGSPAILHGTCTTCHDTPNVGNHSVGLPLDIGLTDAARRTPDMPLYTLQNLATGATVQVTDPGRALITGKWADIGKFKGPILRGLAARPPYFHNGFAAALTDVINFYNTRFAIGFTAQEQADLLAFLRSL